MAIDPRTWIDREAINALNKATKWTWKGYEQVAFLSNAELMKLQGRPETTQQAQASWPRLWDASYWWPTSWGGSFVKSQDWWTGVNSLQVRDAQGNLVTNTVWGRSVMWDNQKATLPNLLPATWAKTQADWTKDNSAVINANGWVTNTLPQGQDAWLPQATVATPNNPVIARKKNTSDNFAIPDWTDIASMDLAGVQDFIDYATIRQNSWKQLTEQEMFKLSKARRREAELAKPQDVGGWLNDRITEAKTNIDTRTKELATQDAEALATFTANQNKQLEAWLSDIDKAEEADKNTLGYILGWQWASTSSYGAEQISKITTNSLAKRQLLRDTVQANIDLQGSKLRKDSQETIDKLQTSLDNMYLKASDLDVENAKALNEYNKDQSKDAVKKIDDILALATAQQQAGIPLTAKEEADAQAYVTSLVKPDWSIDSTILWILQKTNPKIANRALMLSASLQKENMATKDFVKMTVQTGTDARGNPMTKEILYNPKTNETIDPSTWLRGNIPSNNNWGGWVSWQIDLWETPIDTGMKSVLWGNVKLAPTVASMVTNAVANLATQGIQLKIADSYVPYDVKKASYEWGKPWNAPPDKSFHVKGQAFDLSQKAGDNMNDPRIFEALRNAGLQQLNWPDNEWYHRSYWEMWDWKSQSNVKEPTASELALYNEWPWSIKKGWLTQDRFNEIAQSVKDNMPAFDWPTNEPTVFEQISVAPKATEYQSKSKWYADRMNMAAKNLIGVEKEFADRTSVWQAYQDRSPNRMKSQNQQFLESAKENFITAVLRQESGASISPTEFAKEEKKYFPQVWDTPATVKAKQTARELAIKNMYSQAGKDSNGNNIWQMYKKRDIDSLRTTDTTTNNDPTDDYLNSLNLDG